MVNARSRAYGARSGGPHFGAGALFGVFGMTPEERLRRQAKALASAALRRIANAVSLVVESVAAGQAKDSEVGPGPDAA